jgi:1-deoxy-D-xylulose 5-phosphate reductoisomerase
VHARRMRSPECPLPKFSMKRKRLVILGATGSIGESALKVARDIPERMEIVGLAARSNAQKLAAAANEVRPEALCLVDESQIDVLRRALDYQPRIFSGEAGLFEIARLTNTDMVLVAIVGTGGLRPALGAIKAGKDLAVASKEILVMAGEIVMRVIKTYMFCLSTLSTTPSFNAWKANAQRPTPNAQHPMRKVGRWTFPTFAESSSPRPAVRSAKRRE